MTTRKAKTETKAIISRFALWALLRPSAEQLGLRPWLSTARVNACPSGALAGGEVVLGSGKRKASANSRSLRDDKQKNKQRQRQTADSFGMTTRKAKRRQRRSSVASPFGLRSGLRQSGQGLRPWLSTARVNACPSGAVAGGGRARIRKNGRQVQQQIPAG
jgi:hypothetical protein